MSAPVLDLLTEVYILPRQTRNGIAYCFMATPATMLYIATGIPCRTVVEPHPSMDPEYRTEAPR